MQLKQPSFFSALTKMLLLLKTNHRHSVCLKNPGVECFMPPIQPPPANGHAVKRCCASVIKKVTVVHLPPSDYGSS